MNNHRTAQIPAAAPPCRFLSSSDLLISGVEVRVCTLKSSFEDVLDSNTTYKSISESEMQKVCVLDSRELKKIISVEMMNKRKN
ncbi:hypothetical protein P8452_77014 [Trifolium repens]|nr:hypothetical protein P8452_77014 [Trifolium repens]